VEDLIERQERLAQQEQEKEEKEETMSMWMIVLFFGTPTVPTHV
jgi:hypothetical protein